MFDSARCLTVLGDHTLLAYSNLGLTREQYSSLLVAQSFMSLQILLMSPRVLLAFAAVTSMCFDQERLLETVIPRSLIFVTCSSD